MNTLHTTNVKYLYTDRFPQQRSRISSTTRRMMRRKPMHMSSMTHHGIPSCSPPSPGAAVVGSASITPAAGDVCETRRDPDAAVSARSVCILCFHNANMLCYCQHGGVDLMGLKPSLELSSFSAMTLFVGSFDL